MVARKIPLGASRRHNYGYINGDILKISREANNWDEYHRFGRIINRQEYIRSGSGLKLLLNNPHPNIMRIINFNDRWCEVEYIRGVVLDNRSCACPRADKQKPCWIDSHELNDQMIFQIRSAVSHLHKLGIAHTDLTGFNILVDINGTPKIIDLLSCVQLTDDLEKLDDDLVMWTCHIARQKNYVDYLPSDIVVKEMPQILKRSRRIKRVVFRAVYNIVYGICDLCHEIYARCHRTKY